MDSLLEGENSFTLDNVECETISIEMEDLDLWSSFAQVTNEMILTKSGRNMFPVIRVRVSGLQPSALYSICLEFKQIEEIRFKYVSGQWISGGKAEPSKSNRLYTHPDSPNYGSHWMNTPISFAKVKLTNKAAVSSGTILLNSLHKYEPQLKILRIDSQPTTAPAAAAAGQAEVLVKVVPLSVTQFIAVTAYQNEALTSLKIKHNPFAKAFQDKAVKLKWTLQQQSEEQFHGEQQNQLRPTGHHLRRHIDPHQPGGGLLPQQRTHLGEITAGTSSVSYINRPSQHRYSPYPTYQGSSGIQGNLAGGYPQPGLPWNTSSPDENFLTGYLSSDQDNRKWNCLNLATSARLPILHGSSGMPMGSLDIQQEVCQSDFLSYSGDFSELEKDLRTPDFEFFCSGSTSGRNPTHPVPEFPVLEPQNSLDQ